MNILKVIEHLRVAEQSVRIHEHKGISNEVTTAVNETIKLLEKMLKKVTSDNEWE